jgi:uncharacterized protein YndB with AHSA1/START domain
VKIVLLTVGALVAVIVLIVVIGALLPVAHTASRSLVVRKPPREVYALIRDVASFPQWRNEVQRVEVLTATQFREHAAHDAVTYEIIEDQPGRKIVSRIADKNLPYGGSWTWDFEPVDGGTRITVTENGEVYNPLFRFLSRFVLGHTATMDKYLAAVERRLKAEG